MNWLLLVPNATVCLIFLLSISIIAQLRNNSFRILTYVIEFIIFVFSVASLRAVLLDKGNYLLWIFSGIVVGYILFIISIVITKMSPKEGLNALLRSKQVLSFVFRQYRLLVILLVSAVFEEFVWRGVIQTTIKPVEIGIMITAVLFSIRHNRALKGDYLRTLDFFIFSLFLGISYWALRSFVFIVVVHYVRNIGIMYYFMNNRSEDVAVNNCYP